MWCKDNWESLRHGLGSRFLACLTSWSHCSLEKALSEKKKRTLWSSIVNLQMRWREKTLKQGHSTVHAHNRIDEDVPERRSYKGLGGLQKSSDRCVAGLTGGADFFGQQAQVPRIYPSNWWLVIAERRDCKVQSGHSHFESVPGLPPGYFMIASGWEVSSVWVCLCLPFIVF